MWIHEDDWGRISIEPLENAADRAEVAVKLAELSDAHRAPGGIGWTDLVVVPPSPVSIAVRAIPLAELLAVLGASETEPLQTGYSSTSEPVTDGFAVACGTHGHWDRFYGVARGGIVTDLNITHATPESAAHLARLGRWRLALVDLSAGAFVDLADRASIDAYLRDPEE